MKTATKRDTYKIPAEGLLMMIGEFHPYHQRLMPFNLHIGELHMIVEPTDSWDETDVGWETWGHIWFYGPAGHDGVGYEGFFDEESVWANLTPQDVIEIIQAAAHALGATVRAAVDKGETLIVSGPEEIHKLIVDFMTVE